jgi:hypothetical protein
MSSTDRANLRWEVSVSGRFFLKALSMYDCHESIRLMLVEAAKAGDKEAIEALALAAKRRLTT